jgi:VCBS repeat-containing protein
MPNHSYQDPWMRQHGSYGLVPLLLKGLKIMAHTFTGTAAADTITETTGDHTINAGGGANTVTATSGDNTITSGDGVDTITVTSGDNIIGAGDGANTITATSGNNHITSGYGVDTITVTSGDNTIVAGDGANTITATSGENTITTGDGVDTITAGDGGNFIIAGAGANTITTGAGNDTVYTGVDVDTITTGAGDDLIHITGGTDTVTAGAGSDTLNAVFSAATDAVTTALAGTLAAGYTGNISGVGVATFAGVENFDITSGSFNDVITTGDGTDIVRSGAGDDLVILGGGTDEAVYTMADNTSGTDVDVYQGGSGIDTLTLNFTNAEWFNPSVQVDITNYLAFQAAHTDPITGEADSTVFQFTAFDLSASEFESLNVTVDGVVLDPADAAVMAVDDAETINEDISAATPFASVLVNDTVPDLIKSVTWVSGPSEGLLVFNPGGLGGSGTPPDGSFTFNPNGDFEDLALGESRDVSFVYEVEDADGDTDQATVTITVTGSNDAPIATVDTGTTDENAVLTIDVLDNDTDVDLSNLHTVDAVSIASGSGTASIVSNQVQWNPGIAYDYLAVGENATVELAYDMSDNDGGTDSSTVTITVTGSNDAPIATVDTGTTDENAVLTIDVLDNDTDVDLSNLHTVDAVSITSGSGTALIVGNQVQWNPGTAYDYLAVGESATVELAYDISDNDSGTASSTVTITVTGSNDAPTVAAAIANTTNEDATAYSIDLLGGASDVDTTDGLNVADLTVVSGNASGISVSGNTLNVTPSAYTTLAVGMSEVVTYSYDVEDGNGGSVAQTASVTINGVNDAPVAGNDVAATDEDTAININVLSNDNAIDMGDTLSVSVAGTSAQGASLSVNVDGTINYNPVGSAALQALNTGQSVTDSFLYNVSDGHGGIAQATVNVTVAGDNDGPNASNDSASTNEDATGVFIDVLANDAGFSGGKTIIGLNGGGTAGQTSDLGAGLSVQYGKVVYDPLQGAALQALNTGDNATDTFSYEMQDGAGNISTASVTVNVAGITESAVINSGVSETMGFDSLVGAPGSYTEDGMTVTSLYPSSSHIHDYGDDIRNHGSCCSTPYEFTYQNASNGDTSFSMSSFINVQGDGLWTSSAGGSQFVSAVGIANLGTDFQNVEWVRWDESSGSNVIDDVIFTA